MAKSGSGHRAFSRWMQHRTNARMIREVRNGKGAFMGMDVLILKTVGRKSGQLRETPVARFGDGKDSWILVGSGGKANHPDWYLNLVGIPDRASVELPGRDAVPVTPHVLEGAEREQAWKLVATAQPRIAKYQSTSDRQYPVVRLAPR